MAVTHTSEAMFNLERNIPCRGPKLWCGCVQADDGETLDCGLDTIEGMAYMKTSSPADEFMVAESIAATGIITIGTGKYTSVSSAAAADVDAYLMIAGVVR